MGATQLFPTEISLPAGRQSALACLSHEVFDLIVIGGGINGTGIAREASLRGLRVLLLEQRDFGAGTSAYSSRLIHGGLRYLAYGELDLVAESLSDRGWLLRHAPHLVRPLGMAVPVYRGADKPLWMISLGLWLYDLLSWKKTLPWHRLYAKASFLRRYPGVQPQGLQGGTVYFDAQVVFPERLCVENVMAAQQTGRAICLNHAKVLAFRYSSHCSSKSTQAQPEVSGLQFEDRLSGVSYTVCGRVIINAAGPWVDAVLSLPRMQSNAAEAEQPREWATAQRPLIGGTRGTHIVVSPFAGAPETALYVEARSDGRPFFIIPWRQYYLIGTTDVVYDGKPENALPTADEVAYLLSETNAVLPQAHLEPAQVLYAYCGVRPLPTVPSGCMNTGRITRRHRIHDHARDSELPCQGLISVIGGKLTTYPHLAQETVDFVERAYGFLKGNQPHARLSTQALPLPGAQGIRDWGAFCEQAVRSQAAQGLSPAIMTNLLETYGSRYQAVLALLEENPAWAKPLCEGALEIGAQVIDAVRFEWAHTLEDVMLRRLGCGLDGDLGAAKQQRVATLMADELGWTDAQCAQQQMDYQASMRRHYWAFRESEPSGLSPSDRQRVEGVFPAGESLQAPLQ